MAVQKFAPKVNTKLANVLKEKEVTQKSLVEKIRELYPDRPVSMATMSRIVTGQHRNPTVLMILRICQALGVEPNDIIDYKFDEEYSEGIN